MDDPCSPDTLHTSSLLPGELRDGIPKALENHLKDKVFKLRREDFEKLLKGFSKNTVRFDAEALVRAAMSTAADSDSDSLDDFKEALLPLSQQVVQFQLGNSSDTGTSRLKDLLQKHQKNKNKVPCTTASQS